jgi:hypothetical protein
MCGCRAKFGAGIKKVRQVRSMMQKEAAMDLVKDMKKGICLV